MNRERRRTGGMTPYELAELIEVASRLASRLEVAGDGEYHHRLAHAQALALCDSLQLLRSHAGCGRDPEAAETESTALLPMGSS
jgi:hypothetical protein